MKKTYPAYAIQVDITNNGFNQLQISINVYLSSTCNCKLISKLPLV